MARVPFITDASFPESDRQQVDSILLLMHALNGFISRFRSDIELFDYGRDNRKFVWASIAARDATITLWDSGHALKQLSAALKACGSLRTDERENTLRAVWGRYGNAFPHAKRMRRVSAHPVSQFDTPTSRKANARRGLLITGGIRDRTVDHTHEGRLVSFELTEETARRLDGLRDAAFRVFAGLD